MKTRTRQQAVDTFNTSGSSPGSARSASPGERLACPGCGVHAGVRDQVGAGALAYTACSLCLMGREAPRRLDPHLCQAESTQAWVDGPAEGVTCTRCGQQRWPAGPVPDPFICHRCRAVLAGRPNVADPVPSEAQRRAWEASGARLKLVAAPVRVAPAHVPEHRASGGSPPTRGAFPACRCQRGCCATCGPARQDAPSEAWPPMWGLLRWRVFKRDGNQCRRCETGRNLTAHHILPRAMGGSNDLANLITLCASCHDWAEIETAERGRPLNVAELTCPPDAPPAS